MIMTDGICHNLGTYLIPRVVGKRKTKTVNVILKVGKLLFKNLVAVISLMLLD